MLTLWLPMHWRNKISQKEKDASMNHSPLFSDSPNLTP